MYPGPVGWAAEGWEPVHQQVSEPHAIGNAAFGCSLASVVGVPPATGTATTVPALPVVTTTFEPTRARPVASADPTTSVRSRTSPPPRATLLMPAESTK